MSKIIEYNYQQRDGTKCRHVSRALRLVLRKAQGTTDADRTTAVSSFRITKPFARCRIVDIL